MWDSGLSRSDAETHCKRMYLLYTPPVYRVPGTGYSPFPLDSAVKTRSFSLHLTSSLFFVCLTVTSIQVPSLKMQNPSSYYAPPRSDDQILKMWMRSNRAVNSSWGSVTSDLVDDEVNVVAPSSLKGVLKVRTQDGLSPVRGNNDRGSPLPCVWTASSSTTSSSDPSASRISIESTSSLVDLPEIPFIPEDVDIEDRVTPTSSDDDESDGTFWSNLIHPSPSSSSYDRRLPVLEQTSERIVNHTRGRSSSISSTASRPAPAKSILSGSSIKTRKGRSPASVKFLDMPTIHYEEEGELDEYIPDPTATPVSVITSGKKRMFAIFNWLPSPSKKQKLRTVSAPERPMISGPFPLWEARRSSHLSSPLTSPTSPSSKSIRSVKSNASLRSVRSTASRLQGYWGRLSGKDP